MNKDALLYPLRNTQDTEHDTALWNWAQNSVVGQRQQLHQPQTEAELQQLLRDTRGKVRLVGSRLSPGRMLCVQPDDLLLDLSAFTGVVAEDDNSITFAAGTLLQEVYDTLTARDRMLASSPGVIAVQTLAGALATGTHGQGLQQSSLADEALRIRMVLADGSIREFTRGEPEFPAAQVALGSLGVVTAVTLRTQPFRLFTCYKFAVSADGLEQDLLKWNSDYELSKAWWFVDDNLMHVWNAEQASDEDTQAWHANGRQVIEHGDNADSSLNHTIDQTLAQMHRDTQIHGKGGKQFRTVTRFRDFTDVSGDIYQLFCRGIAVPQINVEIAVPLDRTPQVISKIKAWYAEHQPHMHYPIILRCTGASEGWLSPSHQQPSCFFGFVVYYADDGSLSQEGLHFLTEVEKLLAAEGGRPHWGKYYDPQRYQWRDIYPQWDAFRAVRETLDPARRFSNDYTTALFD
ncbi:MULTISPECIES: D-arabinono-1,4-lactone oxidase [Pantoea]|uniref:FAD-binding protein n=1 Tax=Pantoea eucrina TaxID=472693 RepID=A0ABS1Z5T3_9GAMM|nr:MULTISPECIES: D-arabinono-1,4-lactone oxidase [Pantoea]MBM0747750.1 FAD-binding protein [Pantoea eucrina]MCL9647677.1 FAD-binding protein [Pantoea eucrina]MDJ0022435.1 D-arabinono-1,4-lactone oxidase [Pantoea eucrina]OIX99005.1 metal chaperone, involved in Zn homeostasis, GTPase of family protein [Pantoea sp. Ae16]UBB12116.1 FAD-binding protein [Pantoea eucrina]